MKSYLCYTLLKKKEHTEEKIDIQILTDVFGFSRNGPSVRRDEFLGVEADLDDIVQERKQRSQREGGHKQGHHSKLDD